LVNDLAHLPKSEHQYVSSKTTLKQFVEQYDNALKDKTKKENMDDFVSFDTTIACISLFGFESQFQNVFTKAKFKEFQIEIASMMYCNAFLDGTENLKSAFYVIESKKVYERFKDTRFKVFFNGKDFVIQRASCLFELKGILCRHILCIFHLIVTRFVIRFGMWYGFRYVVGHSQRIQYVGGIHSRYAMGLW
jgi:hypothetical protein